MPMGSRADSHRNPWLTMLDAVSARPEGTMNVDHVRVNGLPGHTCVGSSVDVAAAQIWRARLTTAAHMRSPPNSPPTAPDS